MKVLITGKNGQVGHDLVKTVPKGIDLFSFGHDELDITCKSTITTKFNEIKPDYIINAAAYTDVDRAETEYEQATLVNTTAAEILSTAAREISARFFHISTDFVFDGLQSKPYQPDTLASPSSIYGQSKANGEVLVRKYFAAGSIILRTSWVYSSTGRNFVKTILNMMSDRNEIPVVCDQVGTPTWSNNLALTIWAMVTNNTHSGIYHWSDAGVASWYDFATAIYEEALNIQLIDKTIKIIPISTSQYFCHAKRPAYSVLDSRLTNKIRGVQQEHWRQALRKMLINHKKLIQISNELIKP